MFKKMIRALGAATQKVVLGVLLFIVYYVIFGVTVAAAFFLNRKMLFGSDASKNTSWVEADGYDADPVAGRAQS